MIFHLSITNWDEFNPRKDLKSMPWIRLESDVGFSESLFGMPVEQKWAWIFIISYSAKKMSGTFDIDASYFSHHSGVPLKNLIKYIEDFISRGLLVMISSSSRVTDGSLRNPIGSDRNQNESVLYERTNITNERTNMDGVVVDENINMMDYTHPLDLKQENVNTPREKTHAEKCEVIANLWNELAEAEKLPKVKLPLSKARIEAIRPAIRDFTEPGDWIKIMNMIPVNEFNLGKNDRGWKANFDWLFNKTKNNYGRLWESYDEAHFNGDN